MKQSIIDFINSQNFKNQFDIKFSIHDGNIKNYKVDNLPLGSGIYIIFCDTLGITYIGITETNVSNRFDKHIGRADQGKNYDKKNPHKVWDYFFIWSKNNGYSLNNKSEYVFVSFEKPISKKQLKWLEIILIIKFKPLLNDECFELFGHAFLESFNESNNLFKYI